MHVMGRVRAFEVEKAAAVDKRVGVVVVQLLDERARRLHVLLRVLDRGLPTITLN